MWAWKPRSSRDECVRTWAIALHAAPLAIEKPNFTSSWAVAIDSWVWASIPGVKRSKTF